MDAKDTVLMARRREDLQNIVNEYGRMCDGSRLKINVEKTTVKFRWSGRIRKGI